MLLYSIFIENTPVAKYNTTHRQQTTQNEVGERFMPNEKKMAKK